MRIRYDVTRQCGSGLALRRVGGLVIACALLWVAQASNAHGDATDPEFIRGYATAVLERAQSQHDFRVEVHGARLRVDFATKPDVPFDKLLRGLLEIEGVAQAQIFVAKTLVMERSRAPRSIALSPTATPLDGTIDEAPRAESPDEDVPTESPQTESNGWDVFSFEELFKPLIADPRWPRFSVTHQWYLSDDELERVGSATFGESFSFVRSPRGPLGQWEFGLQAGVFSVFDLEASSSDLVNSDFLVGLTATHHLGDFTTMLRIYHQSSHLGDEFLLRNRVNRINLSFEVLDLLLAYEPLQWLRIYGGGGVMIHREPALDRGILQAGLEIESPVALAGGYVRPVFGSDFQFREESDWREDISVRAGAQIEHPFLRRTRFQILAEFYSGRSPNGQFYDRRIETIGIGVYLGI